MKQIVVINNVLKMSKGKIARVCLMLGMNSKYLLTDKISKQWEKNHFTAIVLKTDDYYIAKCKAIKFVGQVAAHIDLGFTQVPKGSDCGFVCFTDLDIFKDLKLY